MRGILCGVLVVHGAFVRVLAYVQEVFSLIWTKHGLPDYSGAAGEVRLSNRRRLFIILPRLYPKWHGAYCVHRVCPYGPRKRGALSPYRKMQYACIPIKPMLLQYKLGVVQSWFDRRCNLGDLTN